VRLSIVDISSVSPGETQVEALQHSTELARLADGLGYERYWLAEHHAAAPQASYAPEALIPAVAAVTNRIRVGSGAVLLNHYSPFKVAETFRQLHAMFPDRIDLGVGRASSGRVLDYALQRDRSRDQQTGAAEDYGSQLAEVQAWLNGGFPDDHPFHRSHPMMPEVSAGPPIWLLGSSPGSASIAGKLGLPYTYAAFINPAKAQAAFTAYRNSFQPSSGPLGMAEPHPMLAVNAVSADTDEEAAHHAMTVHGLYHRLSRGVLASRHPSPDEAIAEMGKPQGATAYADRWNTRSITGTGEHVTELLSTMADEVGAAEVMIQDMILDPPARRRSYELLATGISTGAP